MSHESRARIDRFRRGIARLFKESPPVFRSIASTLFAHLLRIRILFIPRSRRNLNQLACLYQSDKGTHWFSKHGYTLVYEGFLSPLKDKPICLLEIGLRHDVYYWIRSRSRSSLSIWREYFPNSTIVGFDINDFRAVESENVLFVQGDQSQPADLKRILLRVSIFDIIIDDGSHASYDQWTTLKTLLPHVRPGGLYFIEDLDHQPRRIEAIRPKTPRLRHLLRQPSFLAELGITSANVSFYCNESLAIIEKPRSPVEDCSVPALFSTSDEAR